MAPCLLSLSPGVLRAMNLRFVAIVLIRFVCVRFYFDLGCRQSIFYILVIFLPVFYDNSAIFMPFLRSSSFANPLLFDKSAFYLIANQCHSEGRREAGGRQNGDIRDSRPIHSLLASCRFCKHFLPILHSAAKVMAPWRGAMAEKAQFGNLLKIAPFCGVQQWRCKVEMAAIEIFAIDSCAREKLSQRKCFYWL